MSDAIEPHYLLPKSRQPPVATPIEVSAIVRCVRLLLSKLTPFSARSTAKGRDEPRVGPEHEQAVHEPQRAVARIFAVFRLRSIRR